MTSRVPPRGDDLVAQVCRLVNRTLDLPLERRPLGTETRLYGRGLGVDSLDTLRLVAALEKQFDIVIDDTELTLSNFDRIGSIVSLVQKLTHRV